MRHHYKLFSECMRKKNEEIRNLLNARDGRFWIEYNEVEVERWCIRVEVVKML